VTSLDVGCSSAVAWASYCLLDVATSQPRIGVANYCPRQAPLLRSNPEAAVSILVHELIHALVG
jgi:hypothetical protein